MAQEPSGLVCDLERAVELVGANALLARGHEREGLKPDVKLDVAAFHDGLGGHGEVLAALLGVAAPDASLLGRVVAPNRPAMRAHRLASPTEGFEVLRGLRRGPESAGR